MIKLKEKRALSVAEAARYACVSRGTVEYWLSAGKLPFEELPGKGGKNRFRRIRLADLDLFLDKYYREMKQEGRERNKPLILSPEKP